MTKENEKVEPVVEEDVKKQEMTTVPTEDLNKLISRIKRLEASASLAALAKYDAKNKEELGKIIRLRVYNSKIVISWDNLVTNKCEKNQHGVWYEDQQVKIHLEDGSSEKLHYIVWTKGYKHLSVSVKGETEVMDKEDENFGTRNFIVETEDGKELVINEKYIN